MKKNRIDPKHIRLAVINDEEFRKLCRGGIFCGSGGGKPDLGGAHQTMKGDLSMKHKSKFKNIVATDKFVEESSDEE